jgi:hypothetical protein
MMPDETIHELMGLVRSLSGDINSQATKIIEIERKIDLVLAALGGAEGLMEHRLYHAKRKSSSAFWDEVWKESAKGTVKASLWAIIGTTFCLAGLGLITWLKRQGLL